MLAGVFITVSLAFLTLAVLTGLRLLVAMVPLLFCVAAFMWWIIHWPVALVVGAVIGGVLLLGLSEQHNRRMSGKEGDA
jgi:hypothetical protein